MRVLFTNPPWWEPSGKLWPPYRYGVRAGSRWPFSMANPWTFPYTPYPSYAPYPFFMGYASTYVARETGADVILRDSVTMKETLAAYFAWLGKQEFDYIFLESASPSWAYDAGLLARIHEMHPKAKLVLCGPITSCDPANLLTQHSLHACIQGEYEKGAVRVVKGESGVIAHDLLTAAEMNAAPHPWFDPKLYWRYWDGCPKGNRFPHLQVWSSRGCPYKCIFCVWPASMTNNDPTGEGTRSVRHYKRDYLQPYIEKVKSQVFLRSVYFDDDTFNLGSRHTLEMCAMMREIDLPWSAMCRADTIKMDVWKEMAASGCTGVKIGFESGSQFVVDKIVNKHLDLKYAAEVVKVLKGLGMRVHGTFTYGLPGETREQMLETKRYIASLDLDSAQESGTAEIEGTPLAELSRAGALKKYDAAVMNEEYDRNVDGNKKYDEIKRQLQQD